MGLNFLDWIIIGYLGLWAILVLWGIRRGFMREAMTIVGLIFGFVFANMWADYLVAGLNRYIAQSEYWFIVAFAGIYLVTFIVAIMIGRALHRLFDAAQLGWLNRLVGAFFGVIKGVILAMVIIFVMSVFIKPDAGFVKNSRLAPRALAAVNTVYEMAPQGWREALEKQRGTFKTYIKNPFRSSPKPDKPDTKPK